MRRPTLLALALLSALAPLEAQVQVDETPTLVIDRPSDDTGEITHHLQPLF